MFFRLLWIQAGWIQQDLVRTAVKQRQQSVVIDNGRGDILDRKGFSFTSGSKTALVIFPFAAWQLSQDNIKQLAEITGVSAEQLSLVQKKSKEPTILRNSAGETIGLSAKQASQIRQLRIPGVLALPIEERYQEGGMAKQVIGYINQNPERIKSVYLPEWQKGVMDERTMVGAAGLEKSFDRFLQGIEETSLSYSVDPQGKPVPGAPLRYHAHSNQLYPLSLLTTLDQDIQTAMEKTADRTGMKEGAIVVLDAKTRDILAMVSRPSYNQNRVEVEGGGWQNHAVKQLAPGSVFKTIVAAAAVGEGLVSPTEEFRCDGEYGKFGFSCWRKSGHGSVTIEEAFSQSCNIAFAEIAKKVGSKNIEAYAQKLGIGIPAGWSTADWEDMAHFRQIDNEESGAVFSPGVKKDDEGVLIQTSIGQRDVRMSPLQAANMMVTLVQEGHPGEARLVQDIVYRNGISFYHFPVHNEKPGGIDKVTAYKLMRMMRQVVEEGTGMPLAGLKWDVAGKSGTAQVSKKGKPLNHQWFVGVAPVQEPRYAIAVVFENERTTAHHKATQAFAQAVKALIDLEERFSAPRVSSSSPE